MARSFSIGWGVCAASVLLVAIASFGSSTRELILNFGPGDTPFIRGFLENSEVEEKVGWHWTTYNASVDLPFATGGSDVDLSLRYARVFGEEAVVKVRVNEVAAGEFRARGPEVKTTVLNAARVRGPIHLAIDTDSHERRNLGLRMDRLDVRASSGEPLKLRPLAALRPVLGLVLLIMGLIVLGASPLETGAAALLAATAFAYGASRDVFAAWRMTSAMPEMLLLSTGVLFVGKVWLEKKMSIDRQVATWLTSAALVAMVFRLALVSHPDFYYPDLLTHTRVAEAIQNEGPAFFLHPAEALNRQGAWTKPVLGSVSSLPYAVMFHTPFAMAASLFALNQDQIETAMKSIACLISALPILIVAVIASRVGLPPLSAAALCIIPTYATRLSFALLPALFGHVFDLAAILALVILVERADGWRRATRIASVCLFLGHLSYTSSVVNEGLFVLVLGLLSIARGRAGAQTAARVVVAEAVAALLAFALYYRSFVGDLVGLVSRILGLGGATAPANGGPLSVYPIESFWGLLLQRTGDFFGVVIWIAIAGFVWAGAKVWRSSIVQAWVGTYLVLILLRAKIPDVFRYGHETLFITPIVAILAAVVFILLWRRAGAIRLLSIGLGIALGLTLIARQLAAFSDQFGNAL